jgi:hypothetical protein
VLTAMTITFLREFGVGLWLTCPLWLSLGFRHYGVGADRRKEGAVDCV